MFTLIAIGVVCGAVVAFFKIKKNMREEAQRKQISLQFRFWCEVAPAKARLEEWLKARPFLKLNQSAYGKALAWDIILRYRRAIDLLLVEKDDPYLMWVYRLLNGDPPPYDPTDLGSVSTGPLFFWHGKI